MSVFYVESNVESAKEFFDKRMIYRTDTLNPDYKNLTNFNFAEKHLYGRVNRHFVPILPRDYIATLKKFKVDGDGPTLQALNFVVDAFNDLQAQFKKCINAQTISKRERFLSTLDIYKAYESPMRRYTQHTNIYMETIGSLLKSSEGNILSFNQFIGKLLPVLQATGRKNPFTLPAYIKSTYCPMGVSGLVVEIADLKPFNDDEKITDFYNSLNWEFFLNACKEYGFMVDQLIPWRLVADIGSPFMVSYAAQYGLTTTDMILKHPYEGAHVRYFNNFKAYLLRLYNLSIEQNVYEGVLCSNGTTRVVRRRPYPYTLDGLNNKYDDFYFFSLYATIRFFEEESPFSEQERNFLIDDCLEIGRHDMSEAVDIFERIVNKTFDYRGSLSYIRERIKKLKQDAL